MNAECSITQSLLRAQTTVFAQAAKLGITHKVIHYDSGLSLSIIGQYARGETAMSLASMLKLIGVIPDNLLSLMLPDGRLIVQVAEEIDHDALAEACRDYLAAKDRAHHPESPAGRDIAECEDNILRGKFARVRPAA